VGGLSFEPSHLLALLNGRFQETRVVFSESLRILLDIRSMYANRGAKPGAWFENFVCNVHWYHVMKGHPSGTSHQY
jgi:hypothetical protein